MGRSFDLAHALPGSCPVRAIGKVAASTRFGPRPSCYIFVERLWRSVKYEEVYLHDYATVTEATLGLKRYFLFYNAERQHQSLDYQTPKEVYEGQANGGIKTLCAA